MHIDINGGRIHVVNDTIYCRDNQLNKNAVQSFRNVPTELVSQFHAIFVIERRKRQSGNYIIYRDALITRKH